MKNYIVGLLNGKWAVLCRPKWSKQPFLVATFATEPEATAKADALNGESSEYCHRPCSEDGKLFAVGKAWGLYQDWEPVVTNLPEKYATTLVASLNAGRFSTIPRSVLNWAEGAAEPCLSNDNGTQEAA